MNDDTKPEPADRDDGSLPMPSFEGIVAGTVALMTSWAAETRRSGGLSRHNDLVARKIVSNLFFMAHHPQAQGPLACALGKARAQWIELAREPSPADEAPDAHQGSPEGTKLH